MIKCTFGHVCQTKIQIGLGIHTVWSESSLGAFWIFKDLKFLHTDNEDSDLTVWMCRLNSLCLVHMSKDTFSHVSHVVAQHIYSIVQGDNSHSTS